MVNHSLPFFETTWTIWYYAQRMWIKHAIEIQCLSEDRSSILMAMNRSIIFGNCPVTLHMSPLKIDFVVEGGDDDEKKIIISLDNTRNKRMAIVRL